MILFIGFIIDISLSRNHITINGKQCCPCEESHEDSHGITKESNEIESSEEESTTNGESSEKKSESNESDSFVNIAGNTEYTDSVKSDTRDKEIIATGSDSDASKASVSSEESKASSSESSENDDDDVNLVDIGSQEENADDYKVDLNSVFPGDLVKDTMKKTLEDTTSTLGKLSNTISEDKISSIIQLIKDYNTGIVPPGLVEQLQEIITKYGSKASKTTIKELKKIVQVLRRQLGLEKSIQIMTLFGKQMDSTLTTLVEKLQKSFKSQRKTSSILSEINTYITHHSSTVSTQIITFCYRMFKSYGFSYTHTIEDKSSYTGSLIIEESFLIQKIAESRDSSATFEVKSQRECSPQMYCSVRVMDSVCGFGGGQCAARFTSRTRNGRKTLTCSISVSGCDPRPSVTKLTTAQIIESLKKDGTCKTWVDFAEECVPQMFCLHPRILKEVAPYGGGSCYTHVRGKVCSITWKGIIKADRSLENIKSWSEVDLRKGALKSDGVDFRVSSPQQCENFCTDMLKTFDTACQGNKFECCVKITSHGGGIHICNLKHTCYNNVHANRALLDPVPKITAEELSSKDETIEVPNVPVEVKSVNKTIFLEKESELPQESDSDYSEDEHIDLPKYDVPNKGADMNRATEEDPKIRTEIERENGEVQGIRIHIGI